MSGSIHAASIDGIEYVIFRGTVRYSHCGGLERHIDKIFGETPNCSDVVVDLERADILDSTALGLLAKLAMVVLTIAAGKICMATPATK